MRKNEINIDKTRRLINKSNNEFKWNLNKRNRKKANL